MDEILTEGYYSRPVVRSSQHVIIVIADHSRLEDVLQSAHVLHRNIKICIAVINDFDFQRRACWRKSAGIRNTELYRQYEYRIADRTCAERFCNGLLILFVFLG